MTHIPDAAVDAASAAFTAGGDFDNLLSRAIAAALGAMGAAIPVSEPAEDAPWHTDLMISPEAVDKVLDEPGTAMMLDMLNRIAALEARPAWTADHKNLLMRTAIELWSRTEKQHIADTLSELIVKARTGDFPAAFPDPRVMTDIEMVRRALRFVHVEPAHDDALDALARIETDLTAARAEVETLKAVNARLHEDAGLLNASQHRAIECGDRLRAALKQSVEAMKLAHELLTNEGWQGRVPEDLDEALETARKELE